MKRPAENYNLYKVAELRALCKEKNLKVGGKKAERVVTPVIFEPQSHQPRFAYETLDGQEFDRGHTELE